MKLVPQHAHSPSPMSKTNKRINEKETLAISKNKEKYMKREISTDEMRVDTTFQKDDSQ